MMGPILGGVPRLRFDPATLNIVCDGNSLIRGDGSTLGQNVCVQLAALAPLNGQINVTNLGIDGQSTAQMRTNSTDVDGAYVDGKTNVLILWEGTNSINFSATPQGAFNDLKSYCTDRLAKKPWKIIVMTTLPRRNQGATQAQTDDYNAKLAEYNNLLLTGFASMGARAVIDVRKAGSPFAFADYSLTSFQDASVTPYWASEGAKNIHLNNAGYGLIAGYMAEALQRLPAR